MAGQGRAWEQMRGRGGESLTGPREGGQEGLRKTELQFNAAPQMWGTSDRLSTERLHCCPPSLPLPSSLLCSPPLFIRSLPLSSCAVPSVSFRFPFLLSLGCSAIVGGDSGGR